MRQVPSVAISLGKIFEGFSQVVYRCPAGFSTIAFGRRCSSNHPPVTLEEAEIYLFEDMAKAMSSSLRLCPVLLIESDNKLGAITDFCFNLGGGRLQFSTLRRRINQRNWFEVKR